MEIKVFEPVFMARYLKSGKAPILMLIGLDLEVDKTWYFGKITNFIASLFEV